MLLDTRCWILSKSEVVVTRGLDYLLIINLQGHVIVAKNRSQIKFGIIVMGYRASSIFDAGSEYKVIPKKSTRSERATYRDNFNHTRTHSLAPQAWASQPRELWG